MARKPFTRLSESLQEFRTEDPAAYSICLGALTFSIGIVYGGMLALFPDGVEFFSEEGISAVLPTFKKFYATLQ